MKNEFVMVPRDLAETFDRSHSPAPAWAVERLRAILDETSQQHQGEPVDALLLDDCVEYRHPGYGVGYFGTEIVKLYTHADPGEVERMRAKLKEQHERFMAVGLLCDDTLDKYSKLQAQLAERDALLREAINGKTRTQFDGNLIHRILMALSASAEPSESTVGALKILRHAIEVCEGVGIYIVAGAYNGQARIELEFSRPDPQYLEDQLTVEDIDFYIDKMLASAEPSGPKCKYCGDTGQIMVGRSGDANDGNAPILEPCGDCGHGSVHDEPCGIERWANPPMFGAPVERDERAEFEEWYIRDVGPGLANLSRVNTGSRAYEDEDAMSAWEGWQARAALERKP